MKITINDKRKIFAVQKEFSEQFPFLKIEFFAKSNKAGGGPSKALIKHPSKTLGECRTIHNNGAVTITSNMTVTDLEEKFRSIYGLSVQIFRKSGKIWLETTVTDGWSLEKQNKQGEELSTHLQEVLADKNQSYR